jgi:hypothetical protein
VSKAPTPDISEHSAKTKQYRSSEKIIPFVAEIKGVYVPDFLWPVGWGKSVEDIVGLQWTGLGAAMPVLWTRSLRTPNLMWLGQRLLFSDHL